MTRELEQVEDIKLLVDTFYNKIREDDLLGPIFVEVIQDRWTRHQNQIYTFWQTELLGEHLYCVNPFMPRADLPVKKQHFVRWIELFYQTLDEYFAGEIADEAKWRAAEMAEMFQYKIANYRGSNPRP